MHSLILIGGINMNKRYRTGIFLGAVGVILILCGMFAIKNVETSRIFLGIGTLGCLVGAISLLQKG